MELYKQDIVLYGDSCKAELQSFDKLDGIKWKLMWDNWMTHKLDMRSIESREPNITEGISESAFCIYTGSSRVLGVVGGSASADSFNFNTNEAEQIKATSSKSDSPSSFGPKTKWDKLYFMDFYTEKMDGSFSLYEIDVSLFKNKLMSKATGKTFADHQADGKRPRLSLRSIVKEFNIEPIAKNVKIWEDLYPKKEKSLYKI